MVYKDVLRAERRLGKDKICTTSIRYCCPIATFVVAASTAILAGCGGSSAAPPPPSFSIGGTVSGLKAGTSLVLADNGVDSLTISGNATFTFAKSIQSGMAYAVTISTPAPGQTFTVSKGSHV
jgi:hypothetical protein